MIPPKPKTGLPEPPIFIFGAGILGLGSITAAVTRYLFSQREEQEPAAQDDPANPEHIPEDPKE